MLRIGLHVCDHEAMIGTKGIKPVMAEPVLREILQLIFIRRKIRRSIFVRCAIVTASIDFENKSMICLKELSDALQKSTNGQLCIR